MFLNRLFTLLLASVIILSACERDIGITKGVLGVNIPNPEEPEVVQPDLIPDWLKEKLWADEDQIFAKLLALGGGDIEKAKLLVHNIRIRQEQEEVYRGWIEADGIAIIGSWSLPIEHYHIARQVIMHMTSKRPGLRRHLHYDTGFYLILFDPEFIRLQQTPEWMEIDRKWNLLGWYAGICNLGSSPRVCITPNNKTIIFREGRERFGGVFHYGSWEILIHEFAHAYHHAIEKEDRTFNKKLFDAYKNAVGKGLWTTIGWTAEKNYREYWAVNSTAWFQPQKAYTLNGEDVPAINKESIKEFDPPLHALMLKWYPDEEITIK